MISFNNATTSTTLSVLILTVVFLCFFLSLLLNPTVFLYNKKKTSIAGLLFCIISAADFITYIYYPTIILYYASSIDLNKMTCISEHSVAQPQNCISNATLTDEVITIGCITLNVTVLMTTSILAVIRSIQIRYPFYLVRKIHVVLGLLLLIGSQLTLWSFNTVSPLSTIYFFPSHTSVASSNPYGVESLNFRKTLFYLQNLPFTVAQGLAVITSLVTSITLYKRQNVASLNANRNRGVDAMKVILTNVPSFIYLTIFCTPTIMVISHADQRCSASESDGWYQYIVFILLPLLSSIWNPVVFVSLTPESRDSLRSTFARKMKIGCTEATA